MPKGTSKSRSRRNHRDLTNSGNHLARRDVFHRRLACEMLEDRRMLSIGLTNVAITSPVIENDVVHLTGNITGSSPQDTFLLTVDWGDGTTLTTETNFNLPAGTNSFHVTHRYLDQPAGVLSGPFNVNLALSTLSGWANSMLYGGSGNQHGAAIAIAGDNLYLAGTNANTSGGILASYSISSGSMNWLNSLDSTTSLSGIAVSGATVAAVGNALPSAYGSRDNAGGVEVKVLFAKCNTSGSSLVAGSTNFFSYYGGESYNAVAKAQEAGSTYFYATGNAQANYTNNTAVLAKYDADGNLIWTRILGNTGSNNNSAGCSVVVLNGSIYVSGYTHYPSTDSNTIRSCLWKYNNSGNQIWIKDTPFNAGASVMCAAGNYLYLATPLGATSTQKDVALLKYDESGNLLWTACWGGDGNDIPHGIASDGNWIYVTGETDSYGSGGKDVFLLQADASNGTIHSTAYFGGSLNDVGNGVVIDGANVYVVGDSQSYATTGGNTVGEYDLLVLRYVVSSYTATASTTVTVNNLAPTAAFSSPPTNGDVASPISFTFTAAEPGSLDKPNITYRINWGDGSSETVVEPSSGVTCSHFWTDFGSYTIGVYATDKDGAAGLTAMHTIIIANTGAVTINGDAFSAIVNNNIQIDRVGGKERILVDGKTVLNTLAANLNVLAINGQTGNDTLTIDFGGGDPFPVGGISYNGGSQTTRDTLIIQGGAGFNSLAYNATGAGRGSFLINGSDTIYFTGLEPVTVATPVLGTTTVQINDGASHTATITAGPGPGNNTVSFDGGLESLTFANPRLLLELKADPGSDTFKIDSLDSAFRASIEFTGSTGLADSLEVNTNLNLNGHLTVGSSIETTKLNTAMIATTGGQTYGNTVTQGIDAHLTGSTLTLGPSWNATSHSLWLTFTSMITMPPVFTNIANFTSDGTGGTTIAGDFTTIGSQTYGNAVTLLADVTLTSTGGGNLSFSKLDGAHALHVKTAGVTIFGGLVGSTVPLTSLTTDAAGWTQISGGGVTTSGAQTYNDPVVVVTATSSDKKTVIAWNVADSNGITSVKLTIDGKNVSVSRTSGNKYSASYSSRKTLTAGSHAYVITVINSKRVQSTYSGTFKVAATTPTISSIKVKATTSDKKTTIAWKAADVDGIASAALTIDGKTTFSKASSGRTSAYYSSSNIVTAGAHQYAITVTDLAGKQIKTSGKFTVAATAPTISRRLVKVGTSAKATVITWNAADVDGIASVELRIDNIVKSVVQTSGTSYVGSYSASNILPAGKHVYEITITDAFGVSKKSSGTFYVSLAKSLAAAVFSGLSGTAKTDWLVDYGSNDVESKYRESSVDAVFAAY